MAEGESPPVPQSHQQAQKLCAEAVQHRRKVPYLCHNLIDRLQGPLACPRLPMNAQPQLHFSRLYPAAQCCINRLHSASQLGIGLQR